MVLYYITFAVGGFLTFPVLDKLGRRKTCLIFGTGNVIAVSMIMFSTGYTPRLIGYGLMGFFMPQKNSLCYAWLFELMVQRHKVTANTCLNMGDFGTILIVGIVFMFVTPNWAPLYLAFYIIGITGFLFIVLLCPESPKWLLLKGRQKEAIRALNYIARFNMSPNRISEDAEFIEAAVAQNLQNTDNFNHEQTIDDAISSLSARAFRPFEQRVQQTKGKVSFAKQLALLAPIMCMITMQYNALYFMVTVIGGNIFVNCIVMGCGEIMAGFISGWLLRKLKDTHVFLGANILVALFNTVFYYVPAGTPQYLCLLLTIIGVAIQWNSIYILVELRIPPENVGSAIVIVSTLGQLSSTITPMISQSGYPVTMFFILILNTVNITLMCFLSEPGAYLPQEIKISESVTLVKVEQACSIFNDSVLYPLTGGTALSFSRTFHEITNGVIRPRLNETNMDPELLREADDLEASQQLLLKKWGCLDLSNYADSVNNSKEFSHMQVDAESTKDMNEIVAKYYNQDNSSSRLSVIKE